MSVPPITPEQRRAAKIVGVLYLLTMATSMFGELAVRGRLVVRGDAMQTARNLMASERLFRLGIAVDLLTVVGVLFLVWALYVVLKPVNPNGALLAVLFRLVENCMAAAGTLSSFAALSFLGRSEALQAFDPAQLAALATTLRRGQGIGLGVAFVFLGVGSTVFSVLWMKSGYVPRVLAAWGIFSSLVLALVTLAVLVVPALGEALGLSYMIPMFFYEVGLGLWLLVKGLREPAAG
ncbi:MAG TPA: DUF4386 domain-containing protein [Thermoanaerobaculia bacterium]|nr:DUF4386 domain-containing protein [Thermoanaerobaculia bacterium]